MLGSVTSSTYAHRISDTITFLPHAGGDTARSSLGGALGVAQHLAAPGASHLADAAREAFIAAVSEGLLVAIIASTIGALLALRYLPARADKTKPEPAAQSTVAAAA